MGERIYKGCEKVFEAKKFENLKEMITNTKKDIILQHCSKMLRKCNKKSRKRTCSFTEKRI